MCEQSRITAQGEEQNKWYLDSRWSKVRQLTPEQTAWFCFRPFGGCNLCVSLGLPPSSSVCIRFPWFATVWLESNKMNHALVFRLLVVNMLNASKEFRRYLSESKTATPGLRWKERLQKELLRYFSSNLCSAGLHLAPRKWAQDLCRDLLTCCYQPNRVHRHTNTQQDFRIKYQEHRI